MFSIAVIGAGVIGLSTALQIQKEFGSKAKVTIFADKLSPNTTGDIAAGLWTPYLLDNTPKDKILKWSKATQDYVLKLWKEGRAAEMGISLQLQVTLSAKKNFQPPEILKITLGHSVMTQQQLEHYSQLYKQQFTGGVAYMAFIWEASKFLPHFQKRFLENGGEIRVQEIQNFDQLSDFDVVVNCTGLQSRFLVPDPDVHPIRGQIARVHAPWQFHSLLIDTQNANYVITNQDCVILGGTQQVGDFNTDVNEEDRRHILQGCSKYIPSLAGAAVIKHQAGLRPGRDAVRLEIENRKVGSKVLKIVHNYGHGGSGVTLAIGCAIEAASLVKEALGFAGQSKL